MAHERRRYFQLGNKHVTEPSAVAPAARVNFSIKQKADHRTDQPDKPLLSFAKSRYFNEVFPMVISEVDSRIRRYRARFCNRVRDLRLLAILAWVRQNHQGHAYDQEWGRKPECACICHPL